MWLYLLIFVLPLVAYMQLNGRKAVRSGKLLAVYIFGLALFVGLADMFGGYDRYIYSEAFDNIADATTYGENYFLSGCFNYFTVEIGYTALNILISFFTENRYIFILILTLIIYTCLFISIRRYADNYPFALLLFLGLWFFFTFTYLRQVLGATVVWLSLPYVIKRKPIRFLLIWLIACTLHKSAVIFLPVYFIGNHVFSRPAVILFMVLALLMGISPVPNSLFQAYGDASMVEMQTGYSASSGFRIAYLLEAVFFLWIILNNYHFEKVSDKTKVMLNLALLFCAMLLFFIRSENGGRLSWYYMIGLICTLTTIATNKHNRKSFAPLLIAVSLLLFVRIYVSWEKYLYLYPYKTFLTNGYRTGDRIWEDYEYDHAYDKDKFCRTPFRFKVCNREQFSLDFLN